MHKLVLTLLVWQVAAADKIKAHREAGQGTLEYVGMIAVAAIIVVTLIAAASGFDFAGIITKAIDKVKAAAG